jgi:flavodoxin I
MSITIGIFYGSTYGNTAATAKLLQAELERLSNVAVETFDIAFCDIAKMLSFDVVLLGCSTWYIGEVQDDWHDKARGLSSLAWGGKPVALFGSGDQLTYAETFQDALGIIGDHLERGGARLMGFTPALGYKHVSSKAQRKDHFIGLALDDDNEAKLTAPRVKLWVAQLAKELQLIAAPALMAAN